MRPSSLTEKISFAAKTNVFLMFYYNFENQKNNKAQQKAYKKTGNQGKIKSEVSFMDNYISGKFPDPLEPPGQPEN
jgi:hypothetical protein